MGTSTAITRRSILGMIAGLPAVAYAKAGRPPSCDEILAVQVMRMVITAESRREHDFGNYLERDLLQDSPELSRMAADERFEKMRMGRSLLTSLQLDSGEVFEGWELQVHMVGSGALRGQDGFVALLGPQDPRAGHVFAGDQRGVIYEGVLRGGLPREAVTSIATLVWDRAAPIDKRERLFPWSGVLGLILPVSVGCASVDNCMGCKYCGCYCTGSFPACCCCTPVNEVFCCCSSNADGACCDLGCSGCIWRCCAGEEYGCAGFC